MRRYLELVALAGALAGCSDALEQNTTVGQFVAIASSGTSALTLIAASDFSTTVLTLPTIGAASVAGRRSVLVVAVDSGKSGTLVIADLTQRRDAATRVIRLDTTATLAGVAIASDSVAWAADPGTGRLWRVNYRSGVAGSVTLALVPQAGVIVTAGKIFVPVLTAPATQALAVLDTATGALGHCGG